MTEIVNLNKARKARARAAEQAQAAENRVRHGRTAGAQARDRLEAARAARQIDGAALHCVTKAGVTKEGDTKAGVAKVGDTKVGDLDEGVPRG